MELTNKIYVVTGATSGIGLATVEELMARGADIIGVSRSVERCANTAERLQNEYPEQRVAYLAHDLSVQVEVRAAAQGVREQLSAWDVDMLDGLINNAGTFTTWQTYTPEGFEMQWALNYLAGYLLSHVLLPLLEAAPIGRVVLVSSGSHYGAKLPWDDIQLRRRYNPLRAYKQSKMAEVLFVAEWNRRLAQTSGVRAFAADPGLVNTAIGLKEPGGLANWVWSLRRKGGIKPEKAAEGIVFLITEAVIHEAPEFYWKHGKPKAPDAYALDEDVARRLWDLSAQQCGLEVA